MMEEWRPSAHILDCKFLDNCIIFIRKKDIAFVFDEFTIKQQKDILRELERRGYLRVLRDIEDADDDDICVEMRDWITYKGHYDVRECAVEFRLMAYFRRLYDRGRKLVTKRDILRLIDRFPDHLPRDGEALRIIHKYLEYIHLLSQDPKLPSEVNYIKSVLEAEPDDVCVEILDDIVENEDILDQQGILTSPID